MDWWANIVATLSLLLAITAFCWAIKTFGKTKTHLAVEAEIIPSISLGRILGALGPVLKGIIESKSPDAIPAFEKFRKENLPVIRELLPTLVAESPILQRIWPSVATWFSKSPILSVTIRNDGISDASILVVEVGNDTKWTEPEGRAVYPKLTDSMPVTVAAGGDIDIWFPIDKVQLALDGLNMKWVDAKVRVIATNKSKFFAKLPDKTQTEITK